MDERLYLNGALMDLPKRAVSRTLQINDFREIKDRQANYSNNVKLPKTSNNIKVLSNLGFNGSTSRLPYEKISVKYVLNGIELISNGKAVIRNTTDFYNLVIYDGNIDMISLLGFETLEDLDFSNYNHDLSFTTFLDFQSNTYDDGFIYPLRGEVQSTVSNTIPCFYVGKLFEEIFTQKGWTITGDIFSDSNYKSRVTTMDIGFEQDIVFREIPKYVNQTNNTYTGSSVTPVTITLDTINIDETGSYELEILGDFDIRFGSFILNIVKNGTKIIELANASVRTIINDEYFLLFENGDTVTLELVLVGEPYQIIVSNSTVAKLNNSYYVIKFEDIIGNTKQIDFVKDVMQRFNLSFRRVRNKNEIEFITSEALLSNTIDAVDWSNVFSRKIKESYSSKYAKDNMFKYLYDETEEDYADGNLIINDFNLKPITTLITSIFKASKILKNAYFYEYWDEDNKPKQDGLRLFKVNTENKEIPLRLYPGTEYSNLTTNFKFLDFSELDFDQEIVDNYSVFSSMLNDFKIIIVEINLDVIDIYNMNFFKLRYIKQLGRYFYVNKISNFKPNKPTKVELIQIPI